ncbi:pyridoxal-dependent decarboxylase [Actinoalloteichus spitiensis]|uniref:pyridoxal-dependent decarboxylase n=1 Tax=Actinoalloteichus spitiensis TaxID=252394 RepID=UPI00036F9C16
MTPEEFRQLGHQVVDWIADYRENLHRYPVRGQAQPGWLASALAAEPPAPGGGLDGFLDDVDRLVVPALTHWQHPGFFGYFPSNASLPSVLGDLLSAGLGVQGMLWSTSPAATELEQHLLDLLGPELGLPPTFTTAGGGGGVIQDSASSALLVSLVAALHRASGGRWHHDGVTGRETVYRTDQTHSCASKACRVAGLGSSAERVVAVDPVTRGMCPSALAEAIRDDVADGRVPVFVCATVGTTGVGAVDPLVEIAEVCAEHGVWLHVDAAWAGVAGLCPEFRPLLAGVEGVDSFATNAHKWLLTALDCTLLWTRWPEAVTGALTISPEFLRDAASDSGLVRDYRDWQVPLGRRFRALKLWAVLRWYGLDGLRAHLRRHVRLAGDLADRVRAHPAFTLAAPPVLGLVCLRVVSGRGAEDDDRLPRSVLRRVNDGGRVFVTHAALEGRYLIRVAIGGELTEEADIDTLWAELRAAAEAEGALA